MLLFFSHHERVRKGAEKGGGNTAILVRMLGAIPGILHSYPARTAILVRCPPRCRVFTTDVEKERYKLSAPSVSPVPGRTPST